MKPDSASRKMSEQGVERLAERLVQLDGPAQVTIDFQDRPEDVVGLADAGDHVDRGQVFERAEDRRAAIIGPRP